MFDTLPNMLWNTTGNATNSMSVQIDLNPAVLEGSLDAGLGSVDSVMFPATDLGYVEINAPNHASNSLFLLMAVSGDLTNLLMSMDDAGYIASTMDPLLTGDFNLLLQLDPDAQDEFFAWDLEDFGLSVTAIGVTDQPGEAQADAVPEPMGVWMTMIGVVALLRRRRHCEIESHPQKNR